MKITLAEVRDVSVTVDILNRVTEKLLEKGVQQWEYPWDSKEIEKEIKKGNLFLVKLNEDIIATFSIKAIDKLNSLEIEADSIYLYRIALLPEYQGKNYGLQIVDYSLTHSREKKANLYLDCWAGNKKLRDFYLSVGMKHMGDFPEDDYMISIFKNQ